MSLIPVDHHTAADVAIAKYLEKYESVLPEQARVVLSSPLFSKFVADTQAAVIGGSPFDHLATASEEAVAWCLGMVEVLAMTKPEMVRRLLWSSAERKADYGLEKVL